MKLLHILLVVFLPFSASAKDGNFEVMAGTGGPLFMLQSFLTVGFSYHITENWGASLFFSDGNHYSPKVNSDDSTYGGTETTGQFYSATVSYSPWAHRSLYWKFWQLTFVEFGPAMQKVKNYRWIYGQPLESWKSEIWGLEVGAGGRVRSGNWKFEFLPLILFIKANENVLSGERTERSELPLRIVNVRFGYSF